MKAIVIGRHSGSIPGYEIVEQKNVQFPTTARPILIEMINQAMEAESHLLFQNTPGQVSVAMAQLKAEAFVVQISHESAIQYQPWMRHFWDKKIGVIVSVPGERPAGKEYTFDHELFNRDFDESVYRSKIFLLAKHCNPNANIDGYTVTVDPPMKFEFSHIEWF